MEEDERRWKSFDEDEFLTETSHEFFIAILNVAYEEQVAPNGTEMANILITDRYALVIYW